MEIIEMYVANDGTKFECEADCRKYEQALAAKAIEGQAFLFDWNLTPLKISEQGFEDAYFIVCKTKKGAEFLSENYGDWQNPWEDEEPDSGVWVFCDDMWISAKDVFELAEKIGKTMNKSEMALKPLSLEGYL